MLDRPHRLTTSAGFATAVRTGRRAGTRTLVLHLGADPHGPSGPRVGFVVSKAVGNAVARNRVKRRLRHLARERLDVASGLCRARGPRAARVGRGVVRRARRGDLDKAWKRLDRVPAP